MKKTHFIPTVLLLPRRDGLIPNEGQYDGNFTELILLVSFKTYMSIHVNIYLLCVVLDSVLSFVILDLGCKIRLEYPHLCFSYCCIVFMIT